MTPKALCLRLCGTTLLLALMATSSGHIVQADLGDKPYVNFEVSVDNGAQVTNGVLLMCEKDDCSDAVPLQELGPQGFYCIHSTCYALAYGFSPYLQLQLTLSDGRKVTSHVFQKVAYKAQFVATATGNQLKVEEQGQFGQ